MLGELEKPGVGWDDLCGRVRGWLQSPVAFPQSRRSLPSDWQREMLRANQDSELCSRRGASAGGVSVLPASMSQGLTARVRSTALEIRAQSTLAWRLWDGVNIAGGALAEARAAGRPTQPLTQLTQRLTQLMQVVDDVDRAPTRAVREAAERLLGELARAVR